MQPEFAYLSDETLILLITDWVLPSKVPCGMSVFACGPFSARASSIPGLNPEGAFSAPTYSWPGHSGLVAFTLVPEIEQMILFWPTDT
jgi:hypothetical protein